MKILLTGFTGFIGSHIYKHLNNLSFDVHVISRYENFSLTNLHVMDILDFKQISSLVKKIKPDILIHLAWDVTHEQFWDSPKNVKYADASIDLFSCFLESGGGKIISTGSCAEYLPSVTPVCEDSVVDINQLTTYGREKRKVSNWLQDNGETFTWLRIFGIFGEGENPQRLFPSIWKALKKKETFSAQEPYAFFDYINVADFAQKFSELDRLFDLGCVNVGTGKSYSVETYCRILSEQYRFGRFLQVEELKNPSANSRIPDCRKILGHGHSFELNFYESDF